MYNEIDELLIERFLMQLAKASFLQKASFDSVSLFSYFGIWEGQELCFEHIFQNGTFVFRIFPFINEFFGMESEIYVDLDFHRCHILLNYFHGYDLYGW